jgi:RimJ/RimL family protein N-acetyltransferase
MKDVLKGGLVRLCAVDPDELGRAYAEWGRDSEFKRLLDTDPARVYSAKTGREFFQKELEKESPADYFFTIRTLVDDRLLGDLELDVYNWGGRDAFVGLGIGARDLWGKGYGTDAMEVLLRFAFTEINLRRVTLTVFEYNPRAIRSYEKAGFNHEGRLRQALLRDGKRWDMLYLGILRDEWLENHYG